MEVTVTGRLILVAHARAAPSDGEWTDMLRRIQSVELSEVRFLVFTEGGRPSSAQQASLSKALSGRARSLPVAVISDHAGIRFVASALAFFLPRIKTYRSADLTQACAYLELTQGEAQAARDFAARQPSL